MQAREQKRHSLHMVLDKIEMDDKLNEKKIYKQIWSTAKELVNERL